MASFDPFLFRLANQHPPNTICCAETLMRLSLMISAGIRKSIYNNKIKALIQLTVKLFVITIGKHLQQNEEIIMKFSGYALYLICFLALSGCASIAGDNTRMVKVESTPSGADIFVDNQNYGVTPSVITLPSNIYGGKTVTLKKEGYKDQTMVVN